MGRPYAGQVGRRIGNLAYLWFRRHAVDDSHIVDPWL